MKPTPTQLLDRALQLVESESIRRWARTERNYPVWLQVAEKALLKGHTDPQRLCALIVCEAIGL